MDGFFANNSGVAAQTGFASALYQKVLFKTVKHDTTLAYNATLSRWTPVPVGGLARVVRISGQIATVGGAGVSPGNPNNALYVAKVIKNGVPLPGGGYGGTDCFTGESNGINNLPGTGGTMFAGTDIAQPGDYYELIAFITAATTAPIFPAATLGTSDFDNNAFHHFWCGEF
jgi:hypothetical protein